jgi:delta-aminolevulinic acid dehydratase/porphobilinogen synthase
VGASGSRPCGDPARNPAGRYSRSREIDPANTDEAIREVALYLAEGADMITVKRALAYMDIIRRVKQTFGVPLAHFGQVWSCSIPGTPPRGPGH